MLTALVRALRAVLPCLCHLRSGSPERPVLPRPVWDNGIDYDIPTYLRRNTV